MIAFNCYKIESDLPYTGSFCLGIPACIRNDITIRQLHRRLECYIEYLESSHTISL